jgi:NAD(P)-dependent dehydrogenase (short-subunit alcohol dehydrogenase family)
VRLQGKVALIIGAGGGIGRAIALRFATEGSRVVVADVAREAGAKTVEMIDEAGGDASFFPVDITLREELQGLFQRVERQYGRMDVLVNSAGVAGRGRIEDVPDELWDRAITVNLSGVFFACKYAIPLLKRSGGGRILNIASIAGLRGWPGSAVYSATKGGVVALSRTLAADYAREGIRVSAICPTAVDTPLVRQLFEAADDPEAARRAYEEREPMGRMISTDEVAAAALYLASDESPPYSPEPFVV